MQKRKIFKYSVISVLIFLGIFVLTKHSLAANHYASPSGAASWANSTSIETPCSLITAFANASAGDTVYFRGGTYAISSMITPAKSGSEGNPITFTRYQEEDVVWTSSLQGDVIYQQGRGWWTYSYMTWLHTYSGDVSSEHGFVFVGDDVASPHCTFDHITANSNTTGDNFGIIHIKAGDYPTITNCNFTMPTTGSANTNCIIMFNTDYATIENNIFTGAQSTVYLKHAGTSHTHNVFRYNWVKHSSGRYGFFSNFNGMLVEHNIFESSGTSAETNPAIRLADDNGTSTTIIRDNIFRHNTIIGGVYFAYSSPIYAQYNTLECNIITRPQGFNKYGSAAHYTTMDYNLVRASTDSFQDYNDSTRTLAEWQAAYNGSYECTHCLAGAPTFFGGSSPSTIADYALAAGSLGKGACADGDMGANVALVGPDAGLPDDETPPTSPSGLLVS